MHHFNKIVLNVPHSSIEGLTDPQLSSWNLSPAFYNECILRWTDWYTDYIFACPNDKRIEMVRFPLSRFIVDAERLWNDPMEDIGQGIVYTDFENYHRQISDSHKVEELCNYWIKHQQNLANHLSDDSLLLDCHSFPEHLSNIDICIGYNEDWSRPDDETISLISQIFSHEGYNVGINKPYSNSMTPYAPFQYKSVMIELNKRTYMKEDSLLLDETKSMKLKEYINNVYQGLMQQEATI
jgi:N-formylglutamate amidohydrolase